MIFVQIGMMDRQSHTGSVARRLSRGKDSIRMVGGNSRPLVGIRLWDLGSYVGWGVGIALAADSECEQADGQNGDGQNNDGSTDGGTDNSEIINDDSQDDETCADPASSLGKAAPAVKNGNGQN